MFQGFYKVENLDEELLGKWGKRLPHLPKTREKPGDVILKHEGRDHDVKGPREQPDQDAEYTKNGNDDGDLLLHQAL